MLQLVTKWSAGRSTGGTQAFRELFITLDCLPVLVQGPDTRFHRGKR